MKRSISQQSMNPPESGRRTPDGVTQRPAFLRTLSIEPDLVLQYSSFDFLNDKAKAIVETHATEAAKRWNV